MFSVFLLFILLSFMLYYLIVCSYQSYKEEFNMNERLKQQLDFILEIDKEKNILRQTHLSGHGRRENDAEHAWHMAIMAYLLKDYANEPVDIAKVMIMCLIHDIVEIDAGDTYAYDTERLKTQKAREDAAKERIFSLLPEDQKKELEELLLRQGIHIEYIDTLETLDEKVRQPDALRNQRRRWIATQLFLALKMGRNLPTALLNGNGDYLLKTLQAFIAPRSILLALIGFFSCVLCIFSPTSSIKWWILLILLNGALYLAIPSNMRYKYMSRILRQTPYFVIIMLLNLFHLKGMAQKFNHTQHG